MAGNDDKALREEIEQRAYRRFCERGCQAGADLDDWLTAEREVLAAKRTSTQNLASTGPQPRRKRTARR